MPKFVVDLWLDGYKTEAEMIEACRVFIFDQLSFSGSGVEIQDADGSFYQEKDIDAWQDRIKELEAKLAKAFGAFEEIKRYSPCGDSRRKAIDTLAELTGGKDD